MNENQFDYKPIEEKDPEYKLVCEYATLLKDRNWLNKRIKILKRDNNVCTKCSISQSIALWGQPVVSAEILGITHDHKYVIEPIFGNKHISLHVHHKLYILERNPWDYNDKELVTLCADCHLKLHENIKIQVYKTENDYKNRDLSKIISCPKCGGDGYLPEYSYYEAGKCFLCMGNCFVKIVTNKIQRTF